MTRDTHLHILISKELHSELKQRFLRVGEAVETMLRDQLNLEKPDATKSKDRP